MNTGLRNPGMSALISLAIALAGIAAVIAGAVEMNVTGAESARSALFIGGGIVAAIMGLALLANFTRGVRVIRRIRSGADTIGRWTVSAADIDAFREAEKARNARGEGAANSYKVPRKAPPSGIEVIFVPDGVLVGGTYFGLVTTGMFTFDRVEAVPGSPLSIEFGLVAVTAANMSAPRLYRSVGTLRLPIGRPGTEEAKKVLAHFQKVQRREVIVRPEFWRSRVRIGLVALVVGVIAASAGIALEVTEAVEGDAPLIVTITGVMVGLGGLVLAAIAWRLGVQQRRG